MAFYIVIRIPAFRLLKNVAIFGGKTTEFARVPYHCRQITLYFFGVIFSSLAASFIIFNPFHVDLFPSTRLYLEYKLCRLLLRTLDNRTARVSSRGLRGYSRATSSTVFSPVGNGARPSSRASNQSWPGILTRHFGRRPLGSATSLPAMMNLGLGQKVEISHEKENESGSENNKGQEVKKEGKGYTASIYLIKLYKSCNRKKLTRWSIIICLKES